jgi:hypothetical protein
MARPNRRRTQADKGDIGIMGVDGIDKADIFDEYFDDDKPKITNFQKIKASKNIDEMVVKLEELLFEFTTTTNIMSNDDLKQWLESEVRE